MALCEPTDLATALGIDPLNAVAPAAAASAAVRKYLGYDPATTSYTDYLNPTGAAELVLASCPPGCQAAVTSVYEDRERAFGSDTLLVDGDDYIQLKNGAVKLPVIRRIGRNWPYDTRREVNRLAGTLYPSVGTVKVVYTVDATDVLAVASQAALSEALALWNLFGAGMGVGIVTSDSMDGASVSVNVNKAGGRKQNSADGFASPFVAGLLDGWRKVTVA